MKCSWTSWKESKMSVRADPAAYVTAALLLLTVPVEWLAAAVCAAIFHEACHIAVILLCGGRIGTISVGVGGTEIVTDLDGGIKEFVSAMAGPVGSFLLTGVCRIFPKLAICGCIQGLFNLLPVFPMDGGRMVQRILVSLWPENLRMIQIWMNGISIVLFFGFSVAGTWIWKLGNWPLVCFALFFLKTVFRKRPCKEHRFRVQ